MTFRFATLRQDSRAFRKILAVVVSIMNRRGNPTPMACLVGAYWLDSSAFLREPATRCAPVEATARHVPQQKRNLRRYAHPGADNTSHRRGESWGLAGQEGAPNGGGVDDGPGASAQ